MPIHDWTRVPPTVYHHFHQAWTLNLCVALNQGVLPAGYSALVEQHAGGIVPDVLALETPAGLQRNRAPDAAVLTLPMPRAKHVVKAESEMLLRRANRIAIRHEMGRIICVIEIVSPGNKSSRAGLRSFVTKAVDLMNQGVHLLVIDLFPPTPRDPHGIHAAIWDEIEPVPFEGTPGKPLTLVAYQAVVPKTAYVEPVAIGDALPDMPAFLDEDLYVLAPLEASYQTAWGQCPSAMQYFVLHGTPRTDDLED